MFGSVHYALLLCMPSINVGVENKSFQIYCFTASEFLLSFLCSIDFILLLLIKFMLIGYFKMSWHSKKDAFIPKEGKRKINL